MSFDASHICKFLSKRAMLLWETSSSLQRVVSGVREGLNSIECTWVVIVLHVLGALARALSRISVIVWGRSSIRVRRFRARACLTHIIGCKPIILLVESSVVKMASFSQFRSTHAKKYSQLRIKQNKPTAGEELHSRPKKRESENRCKSERGKLTCLGFWE